MSRRSDVNAGAGDVCEIRHLHPARVSELRQQLIGDSAVAELAETFRLLGDPTRVRILDALSQGELCVCDLASLIGLSESAVSHQLRLLRTLRLVRPRREGRMMYYALDDRHIVTLFRQGLRHVQEAAAAASPQPDKQAPAPAPPGAGPSRRGRASNSTFPRGTVPGSSGSTAGRPQGAR